MSLSRRVLASLIVAVAVFAVEVSVPVPAQAQDVPAVHSVSTTYPILTYSSAYVVPSGPVIAPPISVGPDFIAPYSYYAATTWGVPARQYVGLGTNDFPFYGQRYGHAYDGFTWSALSSHPDARLVRYYYPPVR
jgi:hypothetical protein